jgi:hypothetical protein
MLEDATETVVAGHSPGLNPTQLADHGDRLMATTHDVAVITEAATIVANLGAARQSNGPKPRR